MGGRGWGSCLHLPCSHDEGSLAAVIFAFGSLGCRCTVRPSSARMHGRVRAQYLRCSCQAWVVCAWTNVQFDGCPMTQLSRFGWCPERLSHSALILLGHARVQIAEPVPG